MKQSDLKPQKRHPEKFDVLDLFDAIGRNHKFAFGNKDDEQSFVDIIKSSLDNNASDSMLYGRRTESMFSYVAASLGQCIFIKKEDCGEFFGEGDISIPDYRIVLKNKEQVLVEVKNCHYKSSFTMALKQYDDLSKYSSMMNIKLLYAVYWSKWRLWSLVDPKYFDIKDSKAILSFENAMMQNQMIILGDYQAGTTPPLSVRIYPDIAKPHKIIEKSADFTIGKVELLCNKNIITQEIEKKIAISFILYGEWAETNSVAVIDENIEYIEFLYSPLEFRESQQFGIVGTLSTIISRQYCHLTAPNGKVERFSPKVLPNKFGFVVPDGYQSDTLPLWRFFIKPKGD